MRVAAFAQCAKRHSHKAQEPPGAAICAGAYLPLAGRRRPQRRGSAGLPVAEMQVGETSRGSIGAMAKRKPNPHAQALGRLGGKAAAGAGARARFAKMSAEERAEVA